MKLRRYLLPVAALAFGAAMAGHALAQTSLDDPLDDHSAKRLDRMEKVLREMRAIVFQGRDTGKPVVVEPADTDSQIAALTQRISDLEQTMTRLNGQVEVNGHGLDQSQRTIEALRAENGALRDRLSVLEQKVEALTPPPPPAPPEAAAPAGPAGAPGGDDQAAAFSAARQAFVAGDMATAESGFHDYVTRFGDGPRGPEAQYYLGKTLLARRDFADAAQADIRAVRGYPQTAWAPDAMLDLSHALLGLGDRTHACQSLSDLGTIYPKAPAQVQTGVLTARAEAQCN